VNAEELTNWAAEHDGRINAWWKAQHSWNDKVEQKMYTFDDRLVSAEKKVYWFAGLWAAIGALAGGLISGGVSI